MSGAVPAGAVQASGGLIDAHHHLWDLSVRDQDWITGPEMAPIARDFTLAELTAEAVAAGVSGTVLVQTVADPGETPELLATAASSELIAGVVGWTDLTAPDVADRLAALRELPGGHKLAGIRHPVQGEADPEWLLRPEVLRGLRAVADAGLAYDLLVYPRQLPAAVRAARLLPGLRLVLDHLGKPPVATGALTPWAGHLRALAALPRTVCKLSGLVTEAAWDGWTAEGLRPYADTALDAFGPGRLMFGSDWPVCRLAATYGEVLAAARTVTDGLSEDERGAVFAGTARRVYGLSRTAASTPAVPAPSGPRPPA
ncbi:amidohydrolase family protein [Streptomyces paludis]|uniref:Amidohydrolase n=1 Tax=Streptomyces paludis TaxID=2282738 RepID=A0A345HXS5_9ACTN|nr:amidohydrolase family protein [Streptomyces paludis]AXG81499.1 amidohydrolase [Streptomyces paludis]